MPHSDDSRSQSRVRTVYDVGVDDGPEFRVQPSGCSGGRKAEFRVQPSGCPVGASGLSNKHLPLA